MSLIKVGARVRQKPRIIEGVVMKREIIGEGVTYFVHDDATGQEVPLDENHIEWLSDPAEEAAAEAPAQKPEA